VNFFFINNGIISY